MAEYDTDLSETVHKAIQGNEQACSLLVEAWSPALRHEVQHRLRRKMRSQVDDDDLVQETWTWFAAHRTSLPCDRPESVLKLLTKVAHDKAVDVNRHFECAKSDPNHTQRLEDLTVAEAETLVSHEPEPVQAASLADEWAHLQRTQSILHQVMLGMLRDGYSHAEVAEIFSLSEKTVQRLVRQARESVAAAEPAQCP